MPLSSTPTMTTLAHLTAQRDRFETRSIEDARNCGAISCRTWCNEFAGESGTRWRALIAGDARLEKSCPHGPGARTGGRYMPFAVGGVREKWGRGIDCPALTMRVEGLRERLQQLRCRALAASAQSDHKEIHRAAFRRTSLRQKPLPRMMMWRGKQLTSIGNSVTTDKLPIGAFGAGNA